MDDEPERMDPRCDAGGPGYILWMEYRDDGGYVRATDYDALAVKLAEVEEDRDDALIALASARKQLERYIGEAEAALPAVYRLALEDAYRLMRPMLRSLIAREHAMQDIRALPTPTAAELMARIQTGEKE